MSKQKRIKSKFELDMEKGSILSNIDRSDKDLAIFNGTDFRTVILLRYPPNRNMNM